MNQGSGRKIKAIRLLEGNIEEYFCNLGVGTFRQDARNVPQMMYLVSWTF